MGHNLRVAKSESDGSAWAADLVRRVGKAAKDRRGDRSAKWLSERTAELGYRISPTVIAKLDSGHRGEVLSVPELLVIAAALEVPPVALLYPNMPDGEVEVLPGVVRTALEAIENFCGRADDDTVVFSEAASDGLPSLLRLARMRAAAIFRSERQEATIAKLRARGEYKTDSDWPRVDFESDIRTLEGVIRLIPGATVVEWGSEPTKNREGRNA